MSKYYNVELVTAIAQPSLNYVQVDDVLEISQEADLILDLVTKLIERRQYERIILRMNSQLRITAQVQKIS